MWATAGQRSEPSGRKTGGREPLTRPDAAFLQRVSFFGRMPGLGPCRHRPTGDEGGRVRRTRWIVIAVIAVTITALLAPTADAQDGKAATFFVGQRYPVTLSLLSTSLGAEDQPTRLPPMDSWVRQRRRRARRTDGPRRKRGIGPLNGRRRSCTTRIAASLSSSARPRPTCCPVAATPATAPARCRSCPTGRPFSPCATGTAS